MNILIDLLPSTLNVGGFDYEINNDFRTSILFELMMQDRTLSNKDRLKIAIELYFKKIPPDLEEAINKIVWFYKCGKEDEKKKKVSRSIRIVRFIRSNMMLSTFMQHF